MIGEVPSAAVWNSWGARISTRPPRVTVINDNPDFLALMGDILASDHFVPTLLDEDEPDVLERAGKSKPDLLMIDLSPCVDGRDGWNRAQALRRDLDMAKLPILVCSTDYQAMEELAAQAVNDTRLELIRMPFALVHLTDAIARLLGRRLPS